jgi:hypothetical protein
LKLQERGLVFFCKWLVRFCVLLDKNALDAGALNGTTKALALVYFDSGRLLRIQIVYAAVGANVIKCVIVTQMPLWRWRFFVFFSVNTQSQPTFRGLRRNNNFRQFGMEGRVTPLEMGEIGEDMYRGVPIRLNNRADLVCIGYEVRSVSHCIILCRQLVRPVRSGLQPERSAIGHMHGSMPSRANARTAMHMCKTCLPFPQEMIKDCAPRLSPQDMACVRCMVHTGGSALRIIPGCHAACVYPYAPAVSSHRCLRKTM